jgi:Ca2+-binding EF-hand superfamily protein
MDLEKRAKEMFKKFDMNKNGFIEFEELKHLLEDLANEIGIPIPDEQEVMSLFKQYDLNKDKKISLEEFLAMFEVFAKMKEGQ